MTLGPAVATLDARTNATKGADMPDHDETAEPIPEADALEQAEPVGDTDEDVTPLDEVPDEALRPMRSSRRPRCRGRTRRSTR